MADRSTDDIARDFRLAWMRRAGCAERRDQALARADKADSEAMAYERQVAGWDGEIERLLDERLEIVRRQAEQVAEAMVKG